MLLDAERKAREKVVEHLKYRASLLKSARERSKFDTNAQIRDVKRSYDKEIFIMKKARDNAALVIDAGLTKTIREMEKAASSNYDAASKRLFTQVISLDIDKYIQYHKSKS